MNVPQLRFSGFDGEWELKRIKDIAPLQRGFDLVKENIVPGQYPIGYSNGILGYHNEYKAKGPGVFTGRSGTIGNIHFTESDYWPHNTSLWVTDFKGNDEKFIYYFYKKVDLKKYNAGSTVPTLNRNDVHDLKRAIPKRAEQEKIATFLTLLEERIEKQQERIKRLEQLKKGMMQKIFSQELRFKDEDGGEFPEWEEVALSDLGSTYTGLSGKTKEDFGHGEASFVTYVNVFNNLKASIDGLQAVDLSDGKNQNSVRQGDILFTTSSETPHEVGMASYWAFDQKDVYLNSFCFGFRLTSDLVDGEFLTYLLRSPIYRAVITLLAQGSTRYNISKIGLMKMKVLIPSKDEQERIVRVLSQIDTKLDKEKEKLMVLEEQKKGFMQGMFV